MPSGVFTKWATQNPRRRVGAFLAVLFVLSRIAIVWALTPEEDMKVYERAGRALIGPQTIYVDQTLEYPPGVLPFFLLPGLLSENTEAFGVVYATQLALIEALLCLGIFFLARRGLARKRQSDDLRGCLAVAAYLVASTLLSAFVLDRLDLMVGAVVVGMVMLALRRDQFRWGAEVLLAAGVFFKLTPLLLMAPLFLHRVKTEAEEADGLDFRAGLISLGAFAAPLAGFSGLAFSVWGKAWLGLFSYHTERGLQIESMMSSLLMVVERIFEFGLVAEDKFGAIHVHHLLEDRLAQSWILLFGAAVGLLWMHWVNREKRDPAPWGPADLVEGSILVLGVFMLLNKVLSPQFLLWILPVVSVWLVQLEPQRAKRVWRLVWVICALTFLLIPPLGPWLSKMHALPVAFLLVRNLLLAVLLFFVVGLDPPRPFTGALAQRLEDALCHPLVFVVLVGALVVTQNLYANTDVDIFFHMRVGQDVLASGLVPHEDVYTQVSAGRPFIAHSWLAGTFFALVHAFSGDEGHSMVRVLVALLTTAVVLWGLPEKERRNPLLLPVLVVALTVLNVRWQIRPAIFSIFFAALFFTILLRNRRNPDPRWLAALIPLTALWANTHGAFLLGPLVVFIAAGVHGVEWLFPGFNRFFPGPGATGKNVLLLLCTGALCVAASLINPYGFELLRHAVEMAFGNTYIKTSVLEWQPTLTFRQEYWSLGTLSFVVFSAGGLLVNWKRRPVWEAAFIALAIFLSLRAARFAPYVVVFGFVPALMLWGRAFRIRFGPRAWRRRPGVEAAVLVVLIALGLRYGFIYGDGSALKLGWGRATTHMDEVVDYLNGIDVEGNLYTDYADGSYLILHGGKLMPIVDGRIDVYPPQHIKDYERSLLGGPFLLNFLKANDVQAVSRRSRRINQTFFRTMMGSPDWLVGYVDEEVVVFVNRNRRFPAPAPIQSPAPPQDP
jgi:hypothetical protein